MEQVSSIRAKPSRMDAWMERARNHREFASSLCTLSVRNAAHRQPQAQLALPGAPPVRSRLRISLNAAAFAPAASLAFAASEAADAAGASASASSAYPASSAAAAAIPAPASASWAAAAVPAARAAVASVRV